MHFVLNKLVQLNIFITIMLFNIYHSFFPLLFSMDWSWRLFVNSEQKASTCQQRESLLKTVKVNTIQICQGREDDWRELCKMPGDVRLEDTAATLLFARHQSSSCESRVVSCQRERERWELWRVNLKHHNETWSMLIPTTGCDLSTRADWVAELSDLSPVLNSSYFRTNFNRQDGRQWRRERF